MSEDTYTGERIPLGVDQLEALALRLILRHLGQIDPGDVFDWEDVPLLHEDQVEFLTEIVTDKLRQEHDSRRTLLLARDQRTGIDSAEIRERVR